MRVRCMHFYTAKVLMYIDVCQTYSTKKYTCVYTAVTRDEIDAALAAIVLKPSTPSITPSKGSCLARYVCDYHHTGPEQGQRSVHGSVHPQSLPQSLPMIVDQEHDLHTITGVFN